MKTLFNRAKNIIFFLPLFICLVLLIAFFVLQSDYFLSNFISDPSVLINKFKNSGGVILARDDTPLRIIPTDKGDFMFFTPLASFSKVLIESLVTVEDKNFYSHNGVDLVAILRAVKQNVISRRIVSGASTISQQLIRILLPRPRNLFTKISEAFMAMRLESMYSKKQILEMYLNFAPMFGNIRGMNLASILLFGKSPDLLTLGEAVTLAAIPQSPSGLSPFREKSNHRLRRRRDRILNSMLRAELINLKSCDDAKKENIPSYSHKKPFLAPHFCDYVIKKASPIIKNVRTTIDVGIQDILFKTINSHIARLEQYGATQCCGMVLSANKMQVLAMVGSVEYGPLNHGYNNGCLAFRSGGSTLKPFLYSLALERGYYASYIIPDTMRSFKTPQGDYLPTNANRKSYGPVTIRTALGNSLNISAVKMLNLLGIQDFYTFLTELKILQHDLKSIAFFGLGLAIGNPEIRMIDLIQAYGIFANKGELLPISLFKEDNPKHKALISPATAFIVRDIMSDPSARLLTFGTPGFFKFNRPIALKTGTSTNYRDCWIVGVSSQYLVCLWVGNFSGAPTRGLSGSSACGPILKDLFTKLESSQSASGFQQPVSVVAKKVCGISGQLPTVFCPVSAQEYFSVNSQMPPKCQFHQNANFHHVLPSRYAKWILGRTIKMDSDPFQLNEGLMNSNPYRLIGIDEDAENKPVKTSKIIIGQLNNSSASIGKIKIVSPHDGDRFVLSTIHENFIRFRAIPNGQVKNVVWLVDGKEFVSTQPPYEAYWPMEAGRHIVTALADSGCAKSVSILVER